MTTILTRKKHQYTPRSSQGPIASAAKKVNSVGLTPRDHQQNEFWAKVYYPYHPQSGEDIYVVGKRLHRGEQYYVTLGDDRKQKLVPEWMTRIESKQVTLATIPHLELVALRHLRSLISLKIVSPSNQEKSTTGRENDTGTELPTTTSPTPTDVGNDPITDKDVGGSSKNTYRDHGRINRCPLASKNGQHDTTPRGEQR